MNIAFDMFFARTEARRRGIGRYSHNLMHAMITSDTEHSYFYFYPDLTKGLAALKQQLQQFLHRNRIDVYHIMSPFYLFHLSPSQFETYKNMMPERSWFGTVRVAVTLYDVIPLVYEQQFLNDRIRPVYWEAIKLIRSCDAIFAISETTKQDAARLAGIDPDKITVIMAGLDPGFEAAAASPSKGAANYYGIMRPYVMCTGGSDPRKNTAALIDAFLSVNKRLKNTYQLVVACSMSEEEKAIYRGRASVGGDPNALVLTGYVPDSELIELYKGAKLFAFPSLYEGFGLPVLEAMACGTPVLTSNSSSLREISGDAACLVHPESTEDIAEKMVLLLSQPELLKKLSQRGLKQAARFTWSKASRLVLDTYEAIVRRKLAVVAPAAAPYPSPIGLLLQAAPYLVNDFDVDVYMIGENAPAERDETEEWEDVRRCELGQFEQRALSYDHILYEFGNDTRYLAAVPLMRRFPGVVVLGSNDLHDLAIKSTLERNRLDLYYQVLESEYGRTAHQRLDDLLSGRTKRSEVTVNRHYIGGAYGIVAYSEAQSRSLLAQGYRNVIAAPVPLPETELTRCDHRGDFVFTSFGPHSNAEDLFPMLDALKPLIGLSGRRPIKCRIVGPFAEGVEERLADRIRLLSLAGSAELREAPADSQAAALLWKQTNAAVQLEQISGSGLSYAPYLALSYGVPLIARENVVELNGPGERMAAYLIRDDANNDTLVLNAMLSLYRNESLCQELSREAQAYARRTFTPAAYADAIRQSLVRMGIAAPERSVVWQFSMAQNGVPRITKIQTV
ncbi:glycosyltransferase [Cohnella sp. AR92]|uniref:glycosyltransferase n=1 Tax=Cohnella sp. AR92 TaxID=648716 RepID=UPI000F8C660C|nr:glycosyltransferase [Cohnella sp. AR92]RUS44219.1 glycosyltransferase [Cohnella sp. AR92]